MVTVKEALHHFDTLVGGEVDRQLEKAALAVLATQDEATKAGAFGGSRMYLQFGQHYAQQLVKTREFLRDTASVYLKPHTVQASNETLTALRGGAMRAFDQATSQYLSALGKFTRPPNRPGGIPDGGMAGDAVLEAAVSRERGALEAEIAFILSRPGHGIGATGHRLAAVLSTDIVGYSARMAENETEALSAVEQSMAIVRAAAEKHGGRIFKEMADGALIEFPSATDAMRAALETQQETAAANNAKAEQKPIVLRMGLAVGDIAPNGDDNFGDTVNIASRIQAKAQPGTIYTTEQVFDDLANKMPLVGAVLGPHELKGIARPVVLVKIVPNTAPDEAAVDDGASTKAPQGLQQAGQEASQALVTLAKTVNVLLMPLRGMVWGGEQLEQFIASQLAPKLATIEAEHLITPKASVAASALQAVRFTEGEGELQDMFANLLAKAMDKRAAHGVFPAFVEILKQLTSDEAKILRFIRDGREVAIVHVQKQEVDGNGKHVAGEDVEKNLSLVGRDAGCEYPQQAPTYLDNLARLRLIEFLKPNTFHHPALYAEVEADPSIVSLKRKHEDLPRHPTAYVRSGLELTAFGRAFIRVCIRP